MAKKQASEGKWVETYKPIGCREKDILAKMEKLETKCKKLKNLLGAIQDCPVCVEELAEDTQSRSWRSYRCPLCGGAGADEFWHPGQVKKTKQYVRCDK